MRDNGDRKGVYMEHIWWDSVPKARAFVESIVDDLIQEKSVLLHTANGIPWETSCIRSIQTNVQQQNSLRNFEMLYGKEEPGAVLLQKFCSSEKRAMYRPAKGYVRFLAENDDIVLHERYIWISIPDSEALERWSRFVSEYCMQRARGKSKAVFILQWQGRLERERKRGLQVHSFDDTIDEYDCTAFTTLAASGIRVPELIRYYLAELASTVLQNDIELSAACLRNASAFLSSPFDVIQKLISEEQRSNGQPFTFANSRQTVDKKIWRAQVRTVYPYLEEYRGQFVQKHWNQINSCLPIEAPYGEYYSSPNDVELGTLLHMTFDNLLIVSPQEQAKLKCFRNARNKLSHLDLLTIEEIYKLLDR